MLTCPKCSAEQVSDNLKFCGFCGSELISTPITTIDDDELQFEVTEAHTPEELTPANLKTETPPEKDDDLGIESNADYMNKKATSNLDKKADLNAESELEESGLIGQSWPPIPTFEEQEEAKKNINTSSPSLKPENNEVKPAPSGNSGQVQKLSEADVKRIEASFYGKNAFLKKDDKKELKTKIDDINDNSNMEKVQPNSNVEQPTLANPTEPVVANTETTDELPKKVDPTPTPPKEVESIPAAPQEVESILAAPQKVESIPAAPQKVESIPAAPQKVESIPAAPQKVESIPAAPQKVESIPAVPKTVEKELPFGGVINERKVPNDLPAPKVTAKSRGIAYFYRNFIEISGNSKLFLDDEVTINNLTYILKPKKIKPAYLYGAGGVLLTAILVFIGSFFVGSTKGQGTIVGFALDNYDQPYEDGATIKFADLGYEVKTNPLGFFQLDDVPSGSTRMEYYIGDDLMKIDYVTVTDNSTSTILLRPDDEIAYNNSQPKETTNNVIASTNTASKNSEATSKKKSKSASTPVATKKQSTTAKKKTVTYPNSKPTTGKLVLASNVSNPKLTVDGKVLGAGNVTYSDIKGGNHDYVIASDGYNSVKGSFYMVPGKKINLPVTLSPLKVAEKPMEKAKEKEKQYNKADDYYYSGTNAFSQKDYKAAIADFTKALEIDPGYKQAVLYRADSYSEIYENEKAYDDYIRAAEMYQFSGDFNKSLNTYNKAIDIAPKDIAAYMGRGKLYFHKKEYRAALGDFNKVTKLDRHNFEAYFKMGEVSYNQQLYKGAIDHFKNARSVDSNHPLTYQYLTLCYMFVNDKNNIKKSYEKFVTYASENQLESFQNDRNFAAVKRFLD